MRAGAVENGEVVERQFRMAIMPRTLEHFGVQMYKHRDAALAELVANAWDAGASNVWISVPEWSDYSMTESEIVIADDGVGMDPDDIEPLYLVVGRNRRSEGQPEQGGRPPMGRKGIGKLAGFGISNRMAVMTVKGERVTLIQLDAGLLKNQAGAIQDVAIPGSIWEEAGRGPGTTVTLTELRAKTPLAVDQLRESLARRFSRRVMGSMNIYVNDDLLGPPTFDFDHREPTDEETEVTELADGNKVTWWAGFSSSTLRRELRGFTILVRGKTAQSSDFFFDVEGTASGQHGTKYLTGVIEADYLDEGTDDESDVVSTDRQDIGWDEERAVALYEWGQALTRRLLREHASRRSAEVENKVLEDAGLESRINALDKPSRVQVRALVKKLGGCDIPVERALDFADTIIRAYEYRQFHDFIDEFDEIGDDAEKLQSLLEHLSGWKVLEGRAILEIVKGRIEIIERFHGMILNDAPETAPTVGAENMHDLIADYPWLLNPEWQVLSEETAITSQLKQWGDTDIDTGNRGRYDFIALTDERRLVVIEIKRAGRAATLEDLQQLERYKDKLSGGEREVSGVFIAGEGYSMAEGTRVSWENRDDVEILTWGVVHARTSKHYGHYRAVLEGNTMHPDFDKKSREVVRTREVLRDGAYRGPIRRAGGLGPQDGTEDDTSIAQPVSEE